MSWIRPEGGKPPRPRQLAALASAALILALLSGCSSLWYLANRPAMEDALHGRPGDWEQDVRILLARLPRMNPHFAADPVMAARFRERGEALIAEIGEAGETIEPERLVARIAALIASIEERHSYLVYSTRSIFPVWIMSFRSEDPGRGFEDRIAWLDEAGILEAGGFGAADLQGALVLGLRDRDGVLLPLEGGGDSGEGRSAYGILDAVTAVEGGLSTEQTQSSYRQTRWRWIRNPTIMKGLGLARPLAPEGASPAPAGGGASRPGPTDVADVEAGGLVLGLRVITRTGIERDILIRALATARVKPPARAMTPRGEIARSGPPGEDNWFLRLGLDGAVDPEGPVLYVHYRVCSPLGTMLASAKRLLADPGVTRLIYDVRDNPGGSSLPGTDFAAALRAEPRFAAPGRAVTLMNGATFSSGLLAVVDMTSLPEMSLGGSEILEPLDNWGEVRTLRLPRSGLVVGTSTKRFRLVEEVPSRFVAGGLIAPDSRLAHEVSWNEWLTGRDVALEKALSFVAAAP